MATIKTHKGLAWANIKTHKSLAAANVKAIGGVSAATGPSYLVSEDFEGSGTPSGWTVVTGTPDFDYATSPAPLRGSQSAYFSTASARPADFTAQSDVWAFFRFNYSATPSANATLFVLYSGTTPLVSLQARTTANQFRLVCGTFSTVSISVTPTTTYFCWIHYIAGTGANAQATAYIGTTTTRPAAVATISDGTATASCDRVLLQGNSGSNTIFDKLLVSATEIADVPA